MARPPFVPDPRLRHQAARELRRRFTPVAWAAMRGVDKDSLVVGGTRYGAPAARLFGVSGNPTVSRRVHLAIGRAVWGDRPAWRSADLVPATVRSEIARRHTPRSWAALTGAERRRLRIDGRRYGTATARAAGVRGHPVTSRPAHLAVGRAVWGDRAELRPLDAARIRAELRRRFRPERWAALPGRSRKRLRLAGWRYGQRVAGVLGVRGRPTECRTAHLAVGRAVWGDLPCLRPAVPPRLDADQVRAALRAAHTPETWARLPLRAARDLVVGGCRYGRAVARVLGVAGSPRHAAPVHRAVGRAVWGDHPALCPPAAEGARLRVVDAIRSRFTPESWVSLTVSVRRRLVLGPLPYGRRVGRLFGVPGDPAAQSAAHRAIGAAVWGTVPSQRRRSPPPARRP